MRTGHKCHRLALLYYKGYLEGKLWLAFPLSSKILGYGQRYTQLLPRQDYLNFHGDTPID